MFYESLVLGFFFIFSTNIIEKSSLLVDRILFFFPSFSPLPPLMAMFYEVVRLNCQYIVIARP